MIQEKLAVIGGSRAYDLLRSETFGPDLQCIKILTPFGESGSIHRFVSPEVTFLFLSRHGDDSYSVSPPFVNYRANLWALKECGVERIVGWSGPGIINPHFKPGELAIPHDLLDETKNRPSTFFHDTGLGFIRQAEPFCSQVRESLAHSLHTLAHRFWNESVYVCTQGPRLETRAEIRKFQKLGADLVGMTLIPEVFLARELEMCYAAVCYLTNYAEGIQNRPVAPGILFEGMSSEEDDQAAETAVQRLPAVVRLSLTYLKDRERTCECKNAMLRYKKRGQIGEDWHTWIKPVRE